jgi:hypothetical protein
MTLELYLTQRTVVPRGGALTDVQFTKASHVLRGMGIGILEKTPNAIDQLEKKGMAPEG